MKGVMADVKHLNHTSFPWLFVKGIVDIAHILTAFGAFYWNGIVK